MTQTTYSIGEDAIEEAIQALDNAAVTLNQYLHGQQPADPVDAYQEARAAYDTLCAIVSEHVGPDPDADDPA